MKIGYSVVALAAVTTLVVVAAGTGAQAAPLPSSPAVGASAPVAGSPSGKALVRVDGGNALTRKTGKHSYKLAVSSGAKITWMGEVQGKGLRAGTFSHNGLVKGWSRLGHRSGVPTLATITWGSKAALTLIKKPRINSQGELLFDVRSMRALPEKLTDFSVNVNRASTQSRSIRIGGMKFPLVFDPVSLSSNTQVQASAGGDYSASVAFMQQGSPNVWTNCTLGGTAPLSANPYSFSTKTGVTVDFGPATCNDISFLANSTSGDDTTSLVYSTAAENTTILGTFNFTTGKFFYQGILADILQGTNGTVACPVGPYVC